jgi:transcription-repair coupling factor (superfamily II helicase)
LTPGPTGVGEAGDGRGCFPIEHGAVPIRAGGAPEGFDATLVLREAARGDGPVLHIARDDKRAEAMARALAFFDPTLPVLRFPGWDCLPYDRVSPNPEVSATRMATLATLAAGLPGRFVVLTTLNAATQYVPPRDVLRASAFAATTGGRIDEGELRAFLVRMGFVQTPTVTEPGDYAVRGGIIDVWPPGERRPCGSTCSATCSTARAGSIRSPSAPPRSCSGWSLRPSPRSSSTRPRSPGFGRITASSSARQAPTIRFTRPSARGASIRARSIGCRSFHDRLETLFDYLPGATVTLDDQTTPQRIARWEAIADQYDTRATALSQKGRLDTVYKPVPPGCSTLMRRHGRRALADRRVMQFSPLHRRRARA